MFRSPFVVKANLAPVFQSLRGRLQKYAATLTVKTDTPTCYCLEGGLHPQHKTPMPIAWVQIGKAYVSYHLMPVYGAPQLLKEVSPALLARMQGKSCFNFREVDEPLFDELDALAGRGLKAFEKAGFL